MAALDGIRTTVLVGLGAYPFLAIKRSTTGQIAFD